MVFGNLLLQVQNQKRIQIILQHFLQFRFLILLLLFIVQKAGTAVNAAVLA